MAVKSLAKPVWVGGAAVEAETVAMAVVVLMEGGGGVCEGAGVKATLVGVTDRCG